MTTKIISNIKKKQSTCLSKLTNFYFLLLSFNNLDLPTVLIKPLSDYKSKSWESINVPTNNPQLIEAAYSDYFNYGYNPTTWEAKVNEFKEKIISIRNKLSHEDFKRDFTNEYNIDNEMNDQFYLWNLPSELGGLGNYLKNPNSLNYFNTNKRGYDNIPNIEYNKFNSYFVNLHNVEKSILDLKK